MNDMRWRFCVDKEDEYTVLAKPEENGTYSLWCTEHPPCPYDGSYQKTHLGPKSGKICVTPGREPRTLEQAKAILMLVCRGYSTYCRTGAFPNGSARIET